MLLGASRKRSTRSFVWQPHSGSAGDHSVEDDLTPRINKALYRWGVVPIDERAFRSLLPCAQREHEWPLP